ncbi:MAG: hypothetical protein C5B48_08410 [Candidatus Rokuibacteriota bacterium]|nr:MAG: hypothetical protein C5B48_08410 [Candidatus Rokubacteria bacterium]
MYVYQADTYCDSCGERIREQLSRAVRELDGFDRKYVIAAGLAGVPTDPDDESSYDSDDYPKGPYPEEPTDGPDHCASVSECLEPVDLADYGLEPDAQLHGAESRYIGALLNDELTADGVEYLRELLSEQDLTPYQVALHRFWREQFSSELCEVLTAEARNAGEEHGRNAGSWFWNGPHTVEQYKRVLQGVDDGDPEIMDVLPSSPLSGEWADEPTPNTVWADLGMSGDEDYADDVLFAYEDGFNEASVDEIVRVARVMTYADEQDES